MQVYPVGEGASDGLTAISSCAQARFSGTWICDGAIFENGLPEFPSGAPDEVSSAYVQS